MSHQSPIASTYGVIYLGVVLAGVMFGITVMQSYTYFNRYSSDRWAFKLFVAYIFILDSVHQASVTYALWYYLIDSFMRPDRLLLIHWSLDVYFIISLMIGFSVQLLYTYRIWVLTRNNYVCGTIVVFGSASLAFSAAFAKKVIERPFWLVMFQYTWMTDAALGCNIVADLLIAATMWITLHNCPTEYDRTRNVVHKLTVYAMGTGLLTVFMSLLTLALSVATSSLICAALLLYTLLTKSYTNCALMSLNVRRSVRGELHLSGVSTVSTNTMNMASFDNGHYHHMSYHQEPKVFIHKTTTRILDPLEAQV